MSHYALIDFGSNTIRLCVYEVPDSRKSPITNKDLSTLLNYKEMAGLSSYIKDGVLSDKGIKKAIRTINKQLKRASYFSPVETRVFATAVLRNAQNSHHAQKTIEEACGIKITLLTNEEEALLGLVGANLDHKIDTATVVDIGGGSTELTAVTDGKVRAATSLPLGSLASFSRFVSGLLPDEEEMHAITEAFDLLYSELREKSYKNSQLVGIGGSIRSAAKVYGDLFNEGKRSTTLLPEQVAELLAAYTHDPAHFMRSALQTIPDRIHTFIPGCLLIAEVFAQTGAKELSIAKYGVREGFLIEHILSNVA